MFFSHRGSCARQNQTTRQLILIQFSLLILLVLFSNQIALAQTLETERVQYPNSQVAFICGPQLKAGSALNPAPWFDSASHSMGITLGDRFPRVAPFGPMAYNAQSGTWDNVIAGQVSINSGSAVVTGVNSSFTRDVDANGAGPHFNGRLRVRDASGVERSVQVKSVESDTRLTLTGPWAYGSVSNTVADTFYQDPEWGSNTDRYYSDNYYDTALVQYINYYRTGETRYLDYARKTADAWWHSQWIGEGTVTGGPNHLPPRSMAFAGLMLRALDGRPEMWDYLEREVSTNFQHWVYVRRNDGRLYYDIREDGYAQLYAVMLAKVLPDSYAQYGNGTLKGSTGTVTDGAGKRASYLAQTEETAVNFFGRLQRADGSWRWDADLSSTPSEQYRDVEQPFMVGLYLESVVLLHQLSGNQTVKTKLKEQLTRSVRQLYSGAYQQNYPVTDFPQYRWRGMYYFWGGGTVANATSLSPPPVPTTANGDLLTAVRVTRHLNSTIHHAFGYAYFITGEAQYKEMGDEVFDASYGDQVDGIHCLADSGKGKDYDMNFRASGHYLAWRLAAGTKAAPALLASSRNPITTAQMKNGLRTSAVPTSPSLISGALLVSSRLSNALANKDEIEDLINQIKNAQRVFDLERKQFAFPDGVGIELEAALTNARNAQSLARTESGTFESTRLRLGWTAARLKRASQQMKIRNSP
jgi:hypothetical protein